ncbi:MAG: hypothetical protein CBARDCOR_6839 [uncultured Caballeronia sp.]|nr:MAG: hypothetical protein CBARDCOR_6839 [uncultured Caballeronia sp.]
MLLKHATPGAIIDASSRALRNPRGGKVLFSREAVPSGVLSINEPMVFDSASLTVAVQALRGRGFAITLCTLATCVRTGHRIEDPTPLRDGLSGVASGNGK